MSLFLQRLCFIALAAALGACASSPPAGSDPRATPPGDADRSAAPARAPAPVLDLHEVLELAPQGREVEVLVGLFAYAFGEGGAPRVAAQSRIELDGWIGLAERARQALAADEGTREQREALRRFLGRLDPPAAVLDRVSRPAGTPIFRRISTRDDDACADLIADGYVDTPSEGLVCFLTDRMIVRGQEFAVYVPLSWADDAFYIDQASLAADALVDAAEVYARWHRLPAVRLVFTPENYTTSTGGRAVASVPTDPGTPHCPITVWGIAERQSETSLKQTIAHELFHCMQNAFTGSAEGRNVGSYARSKWWVEGTAAYFSNVVYPRYDHEHRHIGRFARAASTLTLVKQSYGTTVWWQYLENRLGGPEAVFNVVRTLRRTGGADEQMRSLSAVRDVDEVWNDFAKAFVAGEIADTTPLGLSRPRPTLPTGGLLPLINSWDGETAFDLTSSPFTIGLYRAWYGQDLELSLSYDVADGAGILQSRPSTFEDWQEPETGFATGCDEMEWDFLLTSGLDGGGRGAVVEYRADVEETEDCDGEDPGVEIPDCLVGRWQADLTQIFRPEQMRALFPDAGSRDGAALRFVGTSGRAVLDLDAAGNATYYFEDVTIRFRGDTSMGETETELYIDGLDGAFYRVEGDEMRFTPGDASTRARIRVALPIGGEVETPMDFDGIFELAERGVVRYTCTDRQLTVVITGPGGSGTMFQNSRYRRVR